MKKISLLLLAVLLSACTKSGTDIKDTHYVIRKEKVVCTPIEVKDRRDRYAVYKEITSKCIFIAETREYAEDYQARQKLEQLAKDETKESPDALQ